MVISDFGIAVEILHSENVKKYSEKNYPLEAIAIQSYVTMDYVREILEPYL